MSGRVGPYLAGRGHLLKVLPMYSLAGLALICRVLPGNTMIREAGTLSLGTLEAEDNAAA